MREPLWDGWTVLVALGLGFTLGAAVGAALVRV